MSRIFLRIFYWIFWPCVLSSGILGGRTENNYLELTAGKEREEGTR